MRQGAATRPPRALNLVDKRTGQGQTAQARDELPRLRALPDLECVRGGYARPPSPDAARPSAPGSSGTGMQNQVERSLHGDAPVG